MFFSSPEEFAKQKIIAVQEYSILAWKAVSNLFSAPRYWDDVIAQMDYIGFGFAADYRSDRLFHRLRAGAPIRHVAGGVRRDQHDRQPGRALHGEGAWPGADRTDGLRAHGLRHGLRAGLDEGDRADRRHARAGHRPGPQAGHAAPVRQRVHAALLLTILADAFGVAGGAIVSILLLGLNPSSYFHTSYRALKYADVAQGLTKPLFSAFIIATVGCYFGMSTKGGTQGVGRSTTQAVVVSSVLIIVVDLLVTRLMIGIFGR